jgi:hypothetical protein
LKPNRLQFSKNRKRAVFLRKSAVFPHQRKSKIYFDGGKSIPHSVSMQHALLTAVTDSTATGLPVSVPISFADVDAAVDFLRSRFADVDWDTFPNRVTIFGDDQRIEGDEDEGLWVLNLVFAPAPARFTY